MILVDYPTPDQRLERNKAIIRYGTVTKVPRKQTPTIIQPDYHITISSIFNEWRKQIDTNHKYH